MDSPFIAYSLLQGTAISDPTTRLTCKKSPSLCHMLFLAHNSKAKSWIWQVLSLRSSWADRYGQCLASSGASRQSGSTTSQAVHISPRDRSESRREHPSHIRCTTAALSSGLNGNSWNAKGTALVRVDGQGARGGRWFLSQMSALLRSFAKP
jgi:hypothetical protein